MVVLLIKNGRVTSWFSPIPAALGRVVPRLWFSNSPPQFEASLWVGQQNGSESFQASFLFPSEMPGEATETVPATEQELPQPQAETGRFP